MTAEHPSHASELTRFALRTLRGPLADASWSMIHVYKDVPDNVKPTVIGLAGGPGGYLYPVFLADEHPDG